ncbi:MAG: hypothetical protein ACRDZR_05640 [Acidimicrobiales bacterium]
MTLDILSLGAGVQSTTVALMSIGGELPKLDHAIFADTGAEPAPVYQHLRWLQPILEDAGIPVHRVSTGDLTADALDPTHRFASIPLFVKLAKPRHDKRGRLATVGMIRRQCTGEYKLKPILAMQRELAGIAPASRPKDVRVRSWQGISWDESERMRDPLRAWITNVYPLVDRRMTRYDCLKWLADHKFPRPPRSACRVCPFRTDHEWRWLRDHAPSDWAEAVAFDHAIRELRGGARGRTRLVGEPYLHRSLVPLDEVDLRTPEDAGQGVLFRSCDPFGCTAGPPASFVWLDELEAA